VTALEVEVTLVMSRSPSMPTVTSFLCMACQSVAAWRILVGSPWGQNLATMLRNEPTRRGDC
jgi:hypothetical protein